MNLGVAPSTHRASFSRLPLACKKYHADEFMTSYPPALIYVLHVTNKKM
jgi:hypothetical protein